MRGTEVLKVQTSCESFGSHTGTDGDPCASQVATGQLSVDRDSLEVASGPELAQEFGHGWP